MRSRFGRGTRWEGWYLLQWVCRGRSGSFPESRRIVRRPAAHAEHLNSVVDTGSAMAKGAASAGNPNVLVRPYASKIVMPITATIAGCQPRAQKPSSDHFKSEARGKGSKGPRH